MFAKLLSPKSSKSRNGLTRRNNSNTKRKEDENGTRNCPNELANCKTETVASVPVKLTHEQSQVGGTVLNNNNNKNVININNQRNQHNQQHHHPADLSSSESSSQPLPPPSLSSSDVWRRRGGNDDASPDDQLIVGDNLILPSTYHDIGANQSTNCAQVNDKQQQKLIDGDDQLDDDNLNSNTMTVDSDNHLTSSLVSEAYRSECIQLRQRIRELEQQNRLLTLLLAEQLLSSSSSTSSTNPVDNQSKLDKLMAINNLTNNKTQFISEYASTMLVNDGNQDEVSLINSSSPLGQGHITMNMGCKGIGSESDYIRSMGNDNDYQLNNNNNHHDDETEFSDRIMVSMSECNSMLGVNLSHINIDRWRRDDDIDEPKTTTNTQSSTSKPNSLTNQLTSSIVPLPISTSTIHSTINSTNRRSINSFNSIDSRGKFIPINNLVTDNSILLTSTTSSCPTTTTTTTTVDPINPLSSTIFSVSSSSSILSSTTTSLSSSISPTLLPATTTSTLSTLTSTLIGSPSSTPTSSPKKLIPSTIIDSSLFQLPPTNSVNCSSSSPSSTNQLEKRILFILASNHTKCFNSTFSSSASSTTSSSSSSSSSVSTDKINCDIRLINKPTNLTLRTLSGSSSSLKDNNLSLSSGKSIASIEKDSPASSATSFDSNGELTSKDEGYSTMSSDVQSDIGGGNIINGQSSSSSSSIVVTINPLTINKNGSTTINTIHNDTDSKDDGTTISKSFTIFNPLPPPPKRTSQPSSSSSSSSLPQSSLSNLIQLKCHQQLKGETIETKSEPKKMGINGSPTNSIPLTIMSTVNPIVVGSSRLTTFKSPNQMDCSITTTSPSTINVKNNKMESLHNEQIDDSLIGDTIKLNCNNSIGNNITTINPIKSIKTMVTIKSLDGITSKKLNGINGESQLIGTDKLMMKYRRNPVNNKSSTHRYSFPPVNTRTNSFDGIEWTPCLIYQPSKSQFDKVDDNSLINVNERKSIEPRYIETAEKSTSADFDDNIDDDTKCLVNKREVIVCDDKMMISHHHHLGKDEKVNDQQFDGKTDELNQVKSDSLGDWGIKMGGGKSISSITKGAASGSLAMKTIRDTVHDEDDGDDYDEEEEEEEDQVKFCYKIDQKRKSKVHKVPSPGSSSSSHGSQSLNRWHSDSQLYSDSMKKDNKPSTIMLGHQVQVDQILNHQHHRSPRRRDITNSHLPSQSFASTCKRSSGYIRRRIKREDRARMDESHRWSTLSTSSSALSDGLEAPIYYERRRFRPRLPMTVTTDTTIGLGNLPKSTETRTGSCRLTRYISSDENHSADDEDSAERFVSHWLHKSGGGLRWDDSEVTWKLNESIDWPDPIEFENACLNPPSSSNSSPSTSSGATNDLPNGHHMGSNMNNDDTFEEIPLIDDDDSDESEKIEMTTTINNPKYSVLISPCDDGHGEVDVSHEGGGEGYISSDQASSVPDDGLTAETHFNGDFYRLCSVGSRTSLQHPDDEINIPPSSSLSSSPPLTDVKEQDEEEEKKEEEDDDNLVNCNDKETKIILRQLTNSNDQDNEDELLVITTTTTIECNNQHNMKSCESINHLNQQESTFLIKSQSMGSSELDGVKVDQQSIGRDKMPIDLARATINSTQSLSPPPPPPSSSSSSLTLNESVKFGKFIDDNETSTSTIKTGSYEESKSINCIEVSKRVGQQQLINSINAVEQSINNDGHETVNDDHIYEEIVSKATFKSVKPSSTKVNQHQPKPILIKSSSTNQTLSSPTRIPLPKQSNSLDAIKSNNKDGYKLRFNSPTKSTIDSITTNNVNNLISKSFINQHQTKRLNNNKMVKGQGDGKLISPSTSSAISNKHGIESKNIIKMMVDGKGKMEKNNNQVNRSGSNRKSDQSIPSLEEFERRLSEDKQMADKIREFYSIFEQSTQSSPATTITKTATSAAAVIPSSQVPSISSTPEVTAAIISTSVTSVKSNRSRPTISGDLIKGTKLGNNERFEDIKLKLSYPKLLRSKGIGGSTGNANITIGVNDCGKMTMKEGHETSWVHVSGFNVGKVGETCHEKQQLPVLTSPSPSAINSIASTTTTITSINHNHRNLMNSMKLSSDSCSSEDEFNLGNIRGNGNVGKKRSSFHQRLLALHRSRRQRKRASDGYMGMGFLPKIRASIVDRLDFYHRFGDKEQEALTSFNFLNELPPTTTSTPVTNTHSKPNKSNSVSLNLNGSPDFVEEQKLLLRCYLNSFQPLNTLSSSTHSLPASNPSSQPVPHPLPTSSSSFTISPYKWPQSPVKSSSSSSRYQSPAGTNYILNHELTKRTVGGVS